MVVSVVCTHPNGVEALIPGHPDRLPGGVVSILRRLLACYQLIFGEWHGGGFRGSFSEKVVQDKSAQYELWLAKYPIVGEPSDPSDKLRLLKMIAHKHILHGCVQESHISVVGGNVRRFLHDVKQSQKNLTILKNLLGLNVGPETALKATIGCLILFELMCTCCTEVFGLHTLISPLDAPYFYSFTGSYATFDGILFCPVPASYTLYDSDTIQAIKRWWSLAFCPGIIDTACAKLHTAFFRGRIVFYLLQGWCKPEKISDFQATLSFMCAGRDLVNKLGGKKPFDSNDIIPASGIARVAVPRGLGDQLYLNHKTAFDKALFALSNKLADIGVMTYELDFSRME